MLIRYDCSCETCIADYPVDVVFNLDMNDVIGFMVQSYRTFLAPIIIGTIFNLIR